MAKKGTIVLDAGHGGAVNIGGSDANHAISPSGALEKNITLEIARLTRAALKAEAAAGGHDVKVVMTRDDDVNLSLRDRAHVAKEHDADILLSIHCNASDAHNARGVETWVRSEASNDRFADDTKFAKSIQQAAFLSIRKHDDKTRDRGVKDAKFGVLSRETLGDRPRACLLELEFIDVAAVDDLLNVGANSAKVREDIAKSVAKALIAAL